MALTGTDTSAALESLHAGGLDCRLIHVVTQSDDFIKPMALVRIPDAVFRGYGGGTLEKIIHSAGA